MEKVWQTINFAIHFLNIHVKIQGSMALLDFPWDGHAYRIKVGWNNRILWLICLINTFIVTSATHTSFVASFACVLTDHSTHNAITWYQNTICIGFGRPYFLYHLVNSHGKSNKVLRLFLMSIFNLGHFMDA